MKVRQWEIWDVSFKEAQFPFCGFDAFQVNYVFNRVAIDGLMSVRSVSGGFVTD